MRLRARMCVHRYIIEIPNFAAIVVVHGVQNSVPSAFIGNAERRPFIIAKNAFNVQRSAARYLRGEPWGALKQHTGSYKSAALY